MDPIPYIEHSFLSIDRKIFVKYRTKPFFRNYSYPKQLFTSTPPHTTSWGGCSPFESNKVSSRGFIATFILKETEEPTCGAHLFWYFSRASSLIVTSSVW